MAATARDHFMNFPALHTSISTASTFLLKTGSHRTLQIPWWRPVSLMHQSFWSNFNPILFKVKTLKTWMKKNKRGSFDEINLMFAQKMLSNSQRNWIVWLVVPKRQSGAITEYLSTCTHSVNLPGSTERVQCQHVLQFECTFTCRCGKAQSMSPLAVHIMFGGLCRAGQREHCCCQGATLSTPLIHPFVFGSCKKWATTHFHSHCSTCSMHHLQWCRTQSTVPPNTLCGLANDVTRPYKSCQGDTRQSLGR